MENSFEYTVEISEKRVWLQPQHTVGVCVNTRLRQMETLKDKKKMRPVVCSCMHSRSLAWVRSMYCVCVCVCARSGTVLMKKLYGTCMH